MRQMMIQLLDHGFLHRRDWLRRDEPVDRPARQVLSFEQDVQRIIRQSARGKAGVTDATDSLLPAHALQPSAYAQGNAAVPADPAEARGQHVPAGETRPLDGIGAGFYAFDNRANRPRPGRMRPIADEL